MILLEVIFNIIYLGLLAWMDWKTHTVPKIATALYVLCSFVYAMYTNPIFILHAVIIAVIMYFVVRNITICTGDRKIIFGLVLQLGAYFGLLIFAISAAVLYLKEVYGNKNPIPLIPVIWIVYIAYVMYTFAIGNLA
jgi:hypothetical protein